MVTQLVNFPDVGPHDPLRTDRDDGRWVEWLGHRAIEAPPCRITIDSRDDRAEPRREASRTYLSVLTHTMEVRRNDGQPFTADAATRTWMGDRAASGRTSGTRPKSA
jgi:hypothetical protein